MNEGGGIKTSIFLFSLLVVVSLFLFLFIQSLYVENKKVATSGLNDLNNCLDISYSIEKQGSTVKITNDKFSKKITSLNIDGEILETSILPGTFQEFILNKSFTIYPNNCKGLSKVISDVA